MGLHDHDDTNVKSVTFQVCISRCHDENMTHEFEQYNQHWLNIQDIFFRCLSHLILALVQSIDIQTCHVHKSTSLQSHVSLQLEEVV